MKKKLLSKLNTQRGSATVEAVIGFTGFLLTIFTILGMVNFCRAQMLVSSAVDTAAKELAQYAYFYEMSGLQKFEGQLDDNGQLGKDNINEVIGTVDSLYGSIVGAKDKAEDTVTDAGAMLAAGQVDLQKFENSVTGLENSAQGVMTGIQSVSDAMTQVGDDPLLYMRSLVAIIGSETMEVAKRAVAVPLSKMFVQKHFGENKDEANATLEALGIEGGLDSMNFNLSKIFSDDEHEDIELTVFYKVRLFQVFDWIILEANVSKVAVCRAWLGGDDVQILAVNQNAPTEPEAGTTPEGEGGESGEGEDDPTEPDATEPEATEPEETTPTNTSTGNWAMQHDPSGYHHSKRTEAFLAQMRNEYLLTDYGPTYYFNPNKDGPTVAYDFDVYAVWDKEPYMTMGGNIVEPGVELLKIGVKSTVEHLSSTKREEFNITQEFSCYNHIVYIPENMPDDQYNRLVADAEKVKQQMEELIASDTTGIPKDLVINISIVRAGGEYDYNSSEEDYVYIGGQEE